MKIISKDTDVGNFVWELPENYVSLLKTQVEILKKQKLYDTNAFEKEEIDDITYQVQQYLRILMVIFLSGGLLINERRGLKNLIELVMLEIKTKLNLENTKTNNS